MSFKVGVKFKDGSELLLEDVATSCLNPDYGQILMYSVIKDDGAQVDVPMNLVQYLSFSKERREVQSDTATN